MCPSSHRQQYNNEEWDLALFVKGNSHRQVVHSRLCSVVRHGHDSVEMWYPLTLSVLIYRGETNAELYEVLLLLLWFFLCCIDCELITFLIGSLSCPGGNVTSKMLNRDTRWYYATGLTSQWLPLHPLPFPERRKLLLLINKLQDHHPRLLVT